MNKYKKSILDLRFITSNLKFVKVGGKENIKKSLNNLNELVERATPKKAIYNNNLCPQCNLLLNSDYKNNGHLLYCPRCGQAIDWSDK